MSPAEKTGKTARKAAADVGDEIGAGFVLVESRDGYHEVRNPDIGVNMSSGDLDKLKATVESYGRDHPDLE